MSQEIKPALVVIDMEEGFLNENSPLYIKQAADTVPALAKVIAEGRNRKIPVFFVNRIYRKDGSDVEACRYDNWLAGGRCLAPNSTGDCSIQVPEAFTPQEGDYTSSNPDFPHFSRQNWI